MITINEFLKRMIVASIVLTFVTSCEVSPCDCARANMNNDRSTLEECDEKLEKMTQSEQLEFNKEVVNCINQQY